MLCVFIVRNIPDFDADAVCPIGPSTFLCDALASNYALKRFLDVSHCYHISLVFPSPFPSLLSSRVGLSPDRRGSASLSHLFYPPLCGFRHAGHYRLGLATTPIVWFTDLCRREVSIMSVCQPVKIHMSLTPGHEPDRMLPITLTITLSLGKMKGI